VTRKMSDSWQNQRRMDADHDCQVRFVTISNDYFYDL